ncbi:Protein YLS3 [Bienertia sinuspersici]
MASLIVSNNHVFIFAMLLSVIGAYYGNIKVGEAQCNGDLQGLITECSEYVQNPGPIKNPSQACCNVLKNVDVKCMCNHITKQAEQMISMPKAMHCLQSCGKSLAHGSKCGSYTVP